MAGLSHIMGSDLTLGPTGSLSLATGPTLTQQRVIRRLSTNPGDYLWNPGYGAGLPAMIGRPADAKRITAIIQSQILQEPGVASTPPPSVTVAAQPDGTVPANVVYTDASTGQNASVTLP